MKRTLVIGIALPHVTFDNYTFASAPALSDYTRLIVEMAGVSTVVEEIAASTGSHRNYAGQPVQPGASTPDTFSLKDLVEMRRREASWFFSRGGVAVCFTHPDVSHRGAVESCDWRRYAWLPAPPGFDYAQHLLPGFGTPGAEVSDESHPFAPFITEFASRLGYRATIDEGAPDFSDYGSIFARGPAGNAIAAELAIGSGRIVLIPPMVEPNKNRGDVALLLATCFDRMDARAAAGPSEER
jgi:hypothetical protein